MQFTLEPSWVQIPAGKQKVFVTKNVGFEHNKWSNLRKTVISLVLPTGRYYKWTTWMPSFQIVFICCCWLGHRKMSFYYPSSHDHLKKISKTLMPCPKSFWCTTPWLQYMVVAATSFSLEPFWVRIHAKNVRFEQSK